MTHFSRRECLGLGALLVALSMASVAGMREATMGHVEFLYTLASVA